MDDQIIGKPRDANDAVYILHKLSGKWHSVITAFTLLNKTRSFMQSNAVCTRVKFRELPDEQIRAYVATGEPLDKAGAYGIQSAGGDLVEKIEGDFSNVVGFPEQAIISLLRQAGFPVQSVKLK
jgi:septum formation protein